MEYPSYKYPVESLKTGASFGNRYAFARLDEQSNLRGLWSSTDNQYYLGEWDIDFFLDGTQLQPETTIFYPESQVTVYSGGGLTVERQFLLPFREYHVSIDDAPELRSACVQIRIRNSLRVSAELVVRHQLYFPANVSEKFTKQPPADQRDKRMILVKGERHCEIVTNGNPREVRIFGSPMNVAMCEGSDRAIVAEHPWNIGPGEHLDLQWTLAFSPNGPKGALNAFHRCSDFKKLLRESIDSYRALLSRSHILTPEPVINRGLQWAKVNTVRVQHEYCIGDGFTNDPPQDIVVLRDLAWYVLGSDYLTPDFSMSLLDLAEKFAIHPDGKVTEYIHANEPTPVQHDYKLNINDDTPLIVLGLYHHASSSGGIAYLKHAYPLMKRICDYILTTVQDGLVRCYADGTNVWGICSWRNIIDDYNLTGAVTEVNAECYYALAIAAASALALGFDADAQRFRSASESLKDSINAKLLSPSTGMYLLNLDNGGTAHHDITGDEIFPVFFETATPQVRNRILLKLTEQEMWTPYGSRTVHPAEKNYDPDFGYQLVGGVWHNLTAWIAYCSRHERPRLVKEALINIYRLAETEKPNEFENVVPGEFPERLHGETYHSRGMTMSPWMPPTYLWLGVEGLLGVKPGLDAFEMNPALPPDWNWLAVRNLPYRGASLSAFVFDGKLYCSSAVVSELPTVVGKLVYSSADDDGIYSFALKVGNEILLFVACDHGVSGVVSVGSGEGTIKQQVQLAGGEARMLPLPAGSLAPAGAVQTTVA